MKNLGGGFEKRFWEPVSSAEGPGMSHGTLYMLANYLGVLAMLTVVGYHFVAVNARYLARNGQKSTA
ncbi:hypothetical protein WG66_000067 [Moniliophthora roreri]|nr:hypothetical protein WG66_000067 [Moniliophthora roreri]